MPNAEKEHEGISISVKTFVSSIILLLCIMIAAGILTRVVPQGSFTYEIVDGRSVIVPGTYIEKTGAAPLPIWRWFTAPFEVLGTDKAVSAGMIIAFILLIGGSFLVLEKSGLLNYMLTGVIKRFEGRKYLLLGAIILLCMLLGSTMGIFEEAVPLVPITIALSFMLGWDSLVGIGMSVLAVGFGFSAAMINPFTIGVVQNLSELPMFSGLFFRVCVFIVTYLVLTAFLIRYARKIEKNPLKSPTHEIDTKLRAKYTAIESDIEKDPAKSKALRIFGIAMGFVLLYIFAGFFLPALSTYMMPVLAVSLTTGALLAGRAAKLPKVLATFLKGTLSLAPSAILILLAMSVTHIMERGGIIDTILNICYNQLEHLGPYGGAIAIFFLILLLDFFVSGASAKAFLLIPIIIPLADMIGITRQTSVLAFALGDGFSNMIYPTNVVLLLTIGIAGIPFWKWFKFVWKVEAVLIGVSLIAIVIAVAVGYGPF